MSDERSLYGDEFVDGVIALRYFREFESEEDAIRDHLKSSFFAAFNEIEKWAGEHDSVLIHRRAWRIHDAFCEARSLAAELAAFRDLRRLGEGRCWKTSTTPTA